MRLALIPLVVALACAGCGGDDADRPDGGGDAGRRRDGGARLDGGDDDAGPTRDAGLGRDSSVVPDGGPGAIAIDGFIDAVEWAGAEEGTTAVSSGWSDANRLTRLLAVVHDGLLYVAVEGALETGAENAILVYVDAERGATAGIDAPIVLTDGEGALDNALSAGVMDPADVRVDYAWGTRDFGRAASGFDDRMGWRDVATTPGDFAWASADDAPAVCSATACETRIALATLGGAASGTIAVYGRLGNTDGTALSNQTVPMDDPALPGTVAVVLDVAR